MSVEWIVFFLFLTEQLTLILLFKVYKDLSKDADVVCKVMHCIQHMFVQFVH